MMSLASCFKGPEASMEMKAFLLLAEEMSKTHFGASNNEILCEMLLLSGSEHFIQDVSLKPQERMGNCEFPCGTHWCGEPSCPICASCGSPNFAHPLWHTAKMGFKSHLTLGNVSSAEHGASV